MLAKLFASKAKNKGQPERNWYKDRYQNALVWRNIFALLSFVSLVLALVCVFTVRSLVPLKTVQPFVIQVDDKTGITQALNPAEAKDLTAKEAVNDFFIVQYIRARESFDTDRADYEQNFRMVRLMSDRRVFDDYGREFDVRNPASRVNRLGVKGSRRITAIRNISEIAPRAIQVRVVIEEVSSDPTKQPKSGNYLINLKYTYQELSLNAQERYLNPLGFVVTSYNLDEETITP